MTELALLGVLSHLFKDLTKTLLEGLPTEWVGAATIGLVQAGVTAGKERHNGDLERALQDAFQQAVAMQEDQEAYHFLKGKAVELFQPERAAFPHEVLAEIRSGDPHSLESALFGVTRRWLDLGLTTSRPSLGGAQLEEALQGLNSQLSRDLLTKFGHVLRSDHHRRAWIGFVEQSIRGLNRSISEMAAEQRKQFASLSEKLDYVLKDVNYVAQVAFLTAGTLAESHRGTGSASQRLEQALSTQAEGIARLEWELALAARMPLEHRYRGRDARAQVDRLLRQHQAVGRDTELADLDHALRTPSNRIIAVEGEPLAGKTAFLCNWIERSRAAGELVIYHLFDPFSLDMRSPGDGAAGGRTRRARRPDQSANGLALVTTAYRNLLHQLCVLRGSRDPGFGAASWESLPDDPAGLEEAFWGLVGEGVPAGTTHPRLVIVLEGIDEAASALPLPREPVPEGVHILVSARVPEHDSPEFVRDWLNAAGHRVRIGRLRSGAAAAYLAAALQGALEYNQSFSKPFLKAFDVKVAGDPLYMRLLADHLLHSAQGRVETRRAWERRIWTELHDTPETLVEFVGEQIGAIAAGIQDPAAQRMLGVLAAALAPLPLADLAEIADLGDLDRKRLLDNPRIRRWMRVNLDSPEQECEFHPGNLRRHFAASQELRLTVRDGRRRLLTLCEERRDCDYSRRFYLIHLLDDLEYCLSRGKAAAVGLQADRLRELLSGLEFAEARLQLLGSRQLRSEYLRAEILFSRWGEVPRPVHAWRLFLDEWSDYLGRFPDQFFERAVNQHTSPLVKEAVRDRLKGGAPVPRHLHWTNPKFEEVHSGTVTALAAQQGSDLLVSAGRPQHLFTVRGTGAPPVFTGHSRRLNVLGFAGGCLLGGGAAGVLWKWPARGQGVPEVLAEPGDPITALAVLRNQQVVYGTAAGAVVVLETTTPWEGLRPVAHRGKVYSLAASARYLGSSGDDGQIQILDLATGGAPFQIEVATQPLCLAVTPNNQWLCMGDELGNLTVWDLENREQLWTIRAHEEEITGLAPLSPGIGQLISVSRDGVLRLWDLRNGRLLAAFPALGDELRCCATARPLEVVCGDAAGRVFLLELKGNSAPDRVRSEK